MKPLKPANHEMLASSTRLVSSLLLAASLALGGCAASSHAIQPSALGSARSSAALLAVVDQPGPIVVETVNSTEWAVSRAGLINLESKKAIDAGFTDSDEPIQIYFHVLRHPTRGTFLVDPDGVVQFTEVTAEGIGRNAAELVRKVKAAQYVRNHPGEVCPAKWEEGEETLAPSLELVGKI